ncbi:MAG: hypothetical protein ACRCXT_18710 [Paraclostridium sp.]
MSFTINISLISKLNTEAVVLAPTIPPNSSSVFALKLSIGNKPSLSVGATLIS